MAPSTLHSSRELTYRSDASTDFPIWWLKWRGLAQGCAFLGFVDIACHLGGKIPQNPNFGGVNRRFQAKLVKSKNMHIIKTTASIATKFCTVITTIKCPSWVVPTHTTNPRWRTAAISKNWIIAISRRRFDGFRPNLAQQRSPTVKNFKF